MYFFRPTIFHNKVVIVGCGGTGSRLVPLIAQFIKTLSYVLDPVIYLIDGDRVEEKNLKRQNFVSTDVGKFKAEVLAARYSKAYNIPIIPITEFLSGASNLFPEAKGHLQKIEKSPYLNILCVDSVKARLEVLKTLHARTVGPSVIIDSGNENDFGQVKILSNNMMSPDRPYKDLYDALPAKSFEDGHLSLLPPDFGYFLEMQAPDNKASCADLDQTMAINSLVANTVFSVVQSMYYVTPIPFHRLNVSLLHGTTPEYITSDYLKSVVSKEGEYFGKTGALGHVNGIRLVNGNITRESYDQLQEFLGRHERFEEKLKQEMQAQVEQLKGEAVTSVPPVASETPPKRKKVLRIAESEVRLETEAEPF